MTSLKKATIFAAFTTLFISYPLLANETYVCKNGDQERTISIVYTNPGSTVPCEVTYDTGMGAESMWQAQNNTGYCEEKAGAFVEKQRGWGWDCNKQ